MSYHDIYTHRRVYHYSKHHKVEKYCRSVEDIYFPKFVVKVCQPSQLHIPNSTASDVYVAESCNTIKKFLKKKLYNPTQLTEDDIFLIRFCIQQIGHHRDVLPQTVEKGINKSIRAFSKLCCPNAKPQRKENKYYEVTA